MEERVIRVLLVEDFEEDAQATLASGGFSVVSRRVKSAEQLPGALQSDDWSVVFSDFNLPNFSAIEALEILRVLKAQVPMIVVTGAIDEESAAAVIKHPAAKSPMRAAYRKSSRPSRMAASRSTPMWWQASCCKPCMKRSSLTSTRQT